MIRAKALGFGICSEGGRSVTLITFPVCLLNSVASLNACCGFFLEKEVSSLLKNGGKKRAWGLGLRRKEKTSIGIPFGEGNPIIRILD